MPELPEVETVLRGVLSELLDKEIEGLDCLYPGTVIIDPQAGKKPFPARVVSGERRGKYLLLHLSGGHTLIIHLRMTGKLVQSKHLQESSKHERACFRLRGGAKLHFIDIRTFGKIIICRTGNVSQYLPSLGAEPLSEDFTVEYLHKVLHGKKTPVKNALLDQSIIAGLGNIYVCEILYRSKVDPETSAGNLTDKQLRSVVKHTKTVLSEAIANNGTSISDFRRIDDKTGEFQNFLRVYQKETCPKGHPIKRIKQGGRSTFYCPVCQK
jgi:formamidopyrimidine-DNA glycosylase